MFVPFLRSKSRFGMFVEEVVHASTFLVGAVIEDWMLVLRSEGVAERAAVEGWLGAEVQVLG